MEARTCTALLSLWLALPACSGSIGDKDPSLLDESTIRVGPDGKPIAPIAPAPGEHPTAAQCEAAPPSDVGHVALHRLNNLEYNNTIRDLLGDSSSPAREFPPDTGGGNFDNNAEVLQVNPLLFEKLEATSEILANAALAAKSTQRSKILTCDPATTGEDICASQVLKAFARRAWRRPPTDDELKGLTAFVPLAKQAGDGFEQGIALALKAALLSPNFLFREEFDAQPESPETHPLNDYEVATRLSYFLWASMPDDELAAAADAGKLGDKSELLKQAQRMLLDSRSDTLLQNFAGQWFKTQNVATVSPQAAVFPAWDETLRAAMGTETTMFLKDFVVGGGNFAEAIAAPYTYVNERLAKHYGIAGVTGDQFRKVDLTSTPRAGLLTQASVLTVTSPSFRTAPVKRGEWVLANLLCSPPGAPPNNVPPLDATPLAPGATLRQRMEAHRKNPVCASCHVQMDPIGFALEHFDGIGQYREMDGTSTIDAKGQLPDGATFDGGKELAAVLQGRVDPISACATQKVFSYALGRDPTDGDTCRLQNLQTSFSKGQYNVKDLLMQMVTDDAFRMRHGGGGGQ